MARRGSRRPTAAWIVRYKGKTGRSYRVRWVDPLTGKTSSRACGGDLALARIERDKIVDELRDGVSRPVRDHTLRELVERIPTFMAGKAPDTIRRMVASLKDLMRLSGDCRLEFLSRDNVMDYRSKRLAEQVAAPTVNRELREIKSALSYASDAGWIRGNPLWHWKAMFLKEPETRIRVVELDEFRKLMKASNDPMFRVLMLVAYAEGLRRSELAKLRWTSVDLDRGVMYVENVPQAGELTKSRKVRTIPMRPEVKRELTKRRDAVPKKVEGGKIEFRSPYVFTQQNGYPLKADWISRQFNDVVEGAKISYCTLHDLRRSWSTIMQRSGVDRSTVKDMGGWSSITVVERHYTGEVPEVHQQAMERVAAIQGQIC